MSHTSDKKRAAAKIAEDGDEEQKPSSNKKISRRDDDDEPPPFDGRPISPRIGDPFSSENDNAVKKFVIYLAIDESPVDSAFAKGLKACRDASGRELGTQHVQ
jgi:hypothetical protein